MALNLAELIDKSGTYAVTVVLGASRADFDRSSSKGSIKIYLTAKDARSANQELKSFVASQVGCYPGDVTVTSGLTSTYKKIYVSKR